MAAMRLRYDIVDVFTDRPFAGNQLAVVHGAEELSTEQCLALAQEFNYSETTFPAPAGPSEYATRIFTPGGEIPFAGHPTLGTAWVLRSLGLLGAGGSGGSGGPGGPDSVTQLCGAGRIGVRFDGDLVELSATPRDLVGPLADELVALLVADLGLSLTDLAGPVYVAGCGLSFAHVPVVPDAIARAQVSTRPLHDYVPAIETRDPFEGINLVALSGSAPALSVHARVFVPGLSVPEDPATGSAAVGLGVALVAAGLLPDGGRFDIAQGIEMGRPSRLMGRVEAVDGAATQCHVAGQVHPVASGEIVVPALS
jgi:trans-2,3-dihydro-3-hydroxyanthranilate isomerase